MKKVLVTGADGFIGSHLTELLVEKGYQVKAFTYYNSFNTWGWLDMTPADKMKEIEVFSWRYPGPQRGEGSDEGRKRRIPSGGVNRHSV